MSIMDKDGPGGACGRKVHWLLTSIIGWHLSCVCGVCGVCGVWCGVVCVCVCVCVCGEAALSCRTVFQWVESFNSGHETVKKVSVQVARQQPICHQLCSVSPSSPRRKNA